MGKGCLDVEQNDLFLGGGMLSENEESDQPSPLAAKLSRLLEAHGHGVTVGAPGTPQLFLPCRVRIGLGTFTRWTTGAFCATDRKNDSDRGFLCLYGELDRA